MKNLIILVVCLVSVFIFSSCHSRSGHRAEGMQKSKIEIQKQKDKKTLDSIMTAFQEQERLKQGAVVSGLIFLNGQIGGDKSPRIEYSVTKKAGLSLDLNLIKSLSVLPGGDQSIPLDVTLEASKAIKEITASKEWKTDADVLETTMRFLSEIEKKTDWKITVNHWSSSGKFGYDGLTLSMDSVALKNNSEIMNIHL